MALEIVRESEPENQEIVSGSDDTRWEEECYRHGCSSAREEAVRRLRAMDERLFYERPQDWKVKRFCQRKILTRFGKITVTRRLYLDGEGKYRFLLDEQLNWRRKQEATVSLTEALVDSATYLPFRNGWRSQWHWLNLLSDLRGAVPSPRDSIDKACCISYNSTIPNTENLIE